MNTKNLIEKYQIPKVTVAILARLPAADVSRYLRDRSLVSGNYQSRIEEAVANIVGVLDAYKVAQAECSGPSLRLDLRDVAGLKQLIEFARKTEVERQRAIEAEIGAFDACRALAEALPSAQ
jgi:hypothetical protein